MRTVPVTETVKIMQNRHGRLRCNSLRRIIPDTENRNSDDDVKITRGFDLRAEGKDEMLCL